MLLFACGRERGAILVGLRRENRWWSLGVENTGQVWNACTVFCVSNEDKAKMKKSRCGRCLLGLKVAIRID